jgi:hypothetical protein
MRTAPVDYERNWPAMGVVAGIASWWRKHAAARTALAELANIGEGEMQRTASDLNVSVPELWQLVSRGPEGASLLKHRLAALRFSPEQVAEIDGCILRDLQRTCTMCEAKTQCRHDLARHPDDTVWKKYCPNAQTLDVLS